MDHKYCPRIAIIVLFKTFNESDIILHNIGIPNIKYNII